MQKGDVTVKIQLVGHKAEGIKIRANDYLPLPRIGEYVLTEGFSYIVESVTWDFDEAAQGRDILAVVKIKEA